MTALDVAYQSQRLRLARAVSDRAAAVFTAFRAQPDAAVSQIVPVVEAGQRNTVDLLVAYMTAKAVLATQNRPDIALDPAAYTTTALRKIAADEVYGRAFTVLSAAETRTGDQAQALESGQAAVTKLATTDLQLAQTHAARDWMAQAAAVTDELRVVAYRRVLTGPGPHCSLCTLAATRTYRVHELMPIHEHCGCTVEPLWGTEPVASVGTTVRVEEDPEIGPRLLADSWSNVGPRLTV